MIATRSFRWCFAHVPEMRRGNTLARSGHEALQELHVLVVDVVDLVRAELADLPTTEERPPLAAGRARAIAAGRAARPAVCPRGPGRRHCLSSWQMPWLDLRLEADFASVIVA